MEQAKHACARDCETARLVRLVRLQTGDRQDGGGGQAAGISVAVDACRVWS